MNPIERETWLRFADYIIPPADPTDSDRIRRTRLAVVLVVTVTICVSLLGAITLALGGNEGVIRMGVPLALIASLAVLRWTRSLAAFGNLLATTWIVGPTLVILSTGTIVCPEAMVLGLASLFAILFGGGRWGVVWLVLEVITLFVCAFVLEESAVVSTAAGPVAFAIVVFAICSTFEWTRKTALTELKSSELSRHMAQQETAIVRADRMASLGQLAAGVAHEINNPLSYVMSNIEFLQRAATTVSEADEDWQDAADEALEGAERIQRIVGELKAFTRVDEEAAASRVSLAEVMDRSVKFASTELRHKVQLSCHLSDTAGLVEADPIRLSQVFVNLLVNAAHAVRDRGGKVEVSVEASHDRVVGYVRDDGPGIPEDVLSRVFDPFFTTKPVGVGTGLGLAVSKTIVESCGGKVRIESTLGEGTTVYVDLPRVEPDATTFQLVRSQAPPRQEPRRLLVVDDDELVLRSVRRLLFEHEVTCVADPEVGLRRIEETPDAWDVIFCDIMMPTMSGLELHRRLVERHSSAADRVTFITGGVFGDEEAANLLDEAPERVVSKPLDRKALLAVVSKAA